MIEGIVAEDLFYLFRLGGRLIHRLFINCLYPSVFLFSPFFCYFFLYLVASLGGRRSMGKRYERMGKVLV